MNHGIINSTGRYHTRDGKSFATQSEAVSHSAAKRAELEARWGIEIDDSIWNRQGLTAATDTRNIQEEIADRDFSPKRRENLSPLDRQIQRLEQVGAKKREADEYKNLNREERLALDLRKKRDRQEAEQRADAVKAAHLKANAADIEAVSELIFQEQFNPESDQRFREQLRKLKLAMETVDSDPAELDQLKNAVNSELDERDANLQGLLGQELEQLQARSQAVKDRMRLRDPEPEKAEHVLDPHGYPDPMNGQQSPEPQAEPATPKASIDTSKNLRQQIMDLSYQSFERDFPLENRKEIFAAEQAFKEGNEAAAMECLNKYAE